MDREGMMPEYVQKPYEIDHIVVDRPLVKIA